MLKFLYHGLIACLLPCLCITSVKAEQVDYLETPPGLFVLFETHRLYYYCQGEGETTVLIDGGIGDASANWLGIQAMVAKHTRICVYDRAGYGMSDSGPGPRSTNIIVRELKGLLEIAKIEPPYVLVGQSFGGFTAQLFAKRYPQQTAGVVLVDSSHPEQVERLAGLDKLPDDERIIVTGHDPNLSSDLTAWQRQWNILNTRRKAIVAQMEELKHFSRSANEVEDVGPVTNIPVIVLTRGVAHLPDLPDGKSMEQQWRSMQASLVNQHPLSKQLVLPGVGHNIHMEQPEVVAKTIVELLNDLSVNSQ